MAKQTRDLEGPANEKWLIGFSRKLVKETIAAPTHNDNLRRGVWEASICYQILLLKKEAEAYGYTGKEEQSVEDAYAENEEVRMTVVHSAIDEYRSILQFFKRKGLIGAQGVQQVDAREFFRTKMGKKEDEVLKPEIEAKAAEKAATNGGGRDE
jgi:hypothetical protein